MLQLDLVKALQERFNLNRLTKDMANVTFDCDMMNQY